MAFFSLPLSEQQVHSSHCHPAGDLESEMKSDSSPERDHAPDDDLIREQEAADGSKKRKRKPYRPGQWSGRLRPLASSTQFLTLSSSHLVPGIGGFMVRQRGGKTGPSRIKLCRTDSADALVGQTHRDEGKRSCPETPHNWKQSIMKKN